ncbi:MAG TPA: gluconokinase [Asticcacaulis sp.]|nr:gluconokinase [Asticcacaulis sp.]
MGISGCGKSTLGHALTKATGYRFIEGDDLHTTANIAKMSSGTSLTDEDRWPWLERIADVLGTASETEGVVVSCSALKYAYRDYLRLRAPAPLLFVFPNLSIEIVRARVRHRLNHYMPPVLLDSQWATLELPRPDERILTLDGAPSTAESVKLIMSYLSTMADSHPDTLPSN